MANLLFYQTRTLKRDRGDHRPFTQTGILYTKRERSVFMKDMPVLRFTVSHSARVGEDSVGSLARETSVRGRP